MPQPIEKEINEYILKLSGKASIPEPLAIDHNYKLSIDGEITDERLTNNHDGTYNKYFYFKPILAEIKKDNGEVIKAKDTRSWSTKVRKMLYRIWEQNASSLTSEEFYDLVMRHIVLNLEEIAAEATKL